MTSRGRCRYGIGCHTQQGRHRIQRNAHGTTHGRADNRHEQQRQQYQHCSQQATSPDGQAAEVVCRACSPPAHEATRGAWAKPCAGPRSASPSLSCCSASPTRGPKPSSRRSSSTTTCRFRAAGVLATPGRSRSPFTPPSTTDRFEVTMASGCRAATASADRAWYPRWLPASRLVAPSICSRLSAAVSLPAACRHGC